MPQKAAWMNIIMVNFNNIGVFTVSQNNPCKQFIFQMSSYQNILIHLDLIPRSNYGNFVAQYFIKFMTEV